MGASRDRKFWPAKIVTSWPNKILVESFGQLQSYFLGQNALLRMFYNLLTNGNARWCDRRKFAKLDVLCYDVSAAKTVFRVSFSFVSQTLNGGILFLQY